MNKKMLLSAIGACVVTLIGSLSAEEPDLTGKTILDWTFPKAFSGDEPSEENLKGKVVVLEYWGVR